MPAEPFSTLKVTEMSVVRVWVKVPVPVVELDLLCGNRALYPYSPKTAKFLLKAYSAPNPRPMPKGLNKSSTAVTTVGSDPLAVMLANSL